MVRITIIVMTMIFTKLMTYPSGLGDDKKGRKQGCILGLVGRSVNEATELDALTVKPRSTASLTLVIRFFVI